VKRMPSERVLTPLMIKNAFDAANSILKEQDGVVEHSDNDFECFTFKSKDVSLVFYPHRTTARNYHIRVRNNGSKDKEKAIKIMDILDNESGYNCTFSRKSN